MKKRKQLFVHSSRNDIILPPVYQMSYRPSSLGTARDVNNLRMSHNQTKKMLKLKKRTYITQEDSEKEDILKWLEDENASAAQVLERLSHTSSLYARLYKQAADEIASTRVKSKEPKLVDLEAKSSYKSANIEVEIQQEKASILAIKEDNNQLKKMIDGKKRELEHMNYIVSLHEKLYHQYRILPDENIKKKEQELQPPKIYYSMINDKVYDIDLDMYKDENEKEEETSDNQEEEESSSIAFDFEKDHFLKNYQNLQVEEEVIQSHLRELESKLRQIQEKQVLLIREKARTMNIAIP